MNIRSRLPIRLTTRRRSVALTSTTVVSIITAATSVSYILSQRASRKANPIRFAHRILSRWLESAKGSQREAAMVDQVRQAVSSLDSLENREPYASAAIDPIQSFQQFMTTFGESEEPALQKLSQAWDDAKPAIAKHRGATNRESVLSGSHTQQ